MSDPVLIEINTERFYLRELTVLDASLQYLSWLKDEETAQYILHTKEDLNSLEQYIRQNQLSDEVLFLGVFCRKSNVHIGNIKYDSIGCIDNDNITAYAVMGILIGEKKWRGVGVAQEIIPATLTYLKASLHIKHVYLGVTKGNDIAINAYKKIGFSETQFPPFLLDPKAIAMSIVIQPSSIEQACRA